ncbi:ParB/RepB/Spo0J family partition protein [Pseudomonas aeruginosa]|uniref:ParB/RepB/Spo0J family partition protein n=1 Tax=Pseudomonas aeruginosa TaxID=287 RepID=UPI000BA16B8A|nr:ParB/RepB/Spo0J family partition protein [Pseudomonas aeruginosa]MBV6140056.1 ParB/RepB/Spo0J family partition protein [Pseudomonas aeruginosa]OZO13443.1 chromosome partitioning protein ParB [Pseudomonas aeruginosa]RPW15230.1 chromosome partitioning protein ParB [Pseudomonas aeruginosa]RUG32071.1 ParB/RepB/Spo0J family partition protein [Pseudomonas aeruginosa]
MADEYPVSQPDNKALGVVIGISVKKIRRGRYQPRWHFDDKALWELVQNIIDLNGNLVEPIIVRPAPGTDEFELIAGERRWRAFKLGNFETIPAIVRHVDDETAALMAYSENEFREPLNSLEKAKIWLRMRNDFDWRQEDLAKRISVDRGVIANHERLLKLPEPVQEHLAVGDLTESKARLLHGLAEKLACSIADEAVAKGLSLREIEALVKRAKKDQPPAPVRRREDPDVARWLRRFSEVIGFQTELEQAKGKEKGGYLKIRYYELSDLSSIQSRLGVRSGDG